MKDDTESRKNYLKSHKRSLSSFQTRKGGGGGGGGGLVGLWAVSKVESPACGCLAFRGLSSW